MEAGYGQSPTVNEVMTPQEWASLSVESRHKLNVYFLEADKPAASPDALRVALEKLVGIMSERCGDHCSNTCPMCDARKRLKQILASSSGAGVQVTGDLLAVAEWAVYALEHGSHIEVEWLRTVAKDKHKWAREVIAAALSRQSQPPDPPCPHGHPERGLTCGPECAPPLSKSVEKGRERACNFTTTSDGDWCTVHLRDGNVCRNGPRRAAEERKEHG